MPFKKVPTTKGYRLLNVDQIQFVDTETKFLAEDPSKDAVPTTIVWMASGDSVTVLMSYDAFYDNVIPN